MKYVDTDVLIYWATDHPEHGEAATRIMRHIELNEKACTSALSLYLFDTVLVREGIPDYAFTTFLGALNELRNLRIEPVNEKTYAKAAPLQRDLDVPLDIAVGLSVAQDRKADAIYSHNPAFDKGRLPRRFQNI